MLQVVLDCPVTDDLLYVKATPTFHHWRTRGKRFGLTFHSSADAQVFETCIQHAALQLQESMCSLPAFSLLYLVASVLLQIGLRLSVCLSVCHHSHGRISLSIFTKFDTEV